MFESKEKAEPAREGYRVTVERVAYIVVLFAAASWTVISAVLLVGTTHEAGRGSAWFWGASFALSSLAAAWSFWELLGGAA